MTGTAFFLLLAAAGAVLLRRALPGLPALAAAAGGLVAGPMAAGLLMYGVDLLLVPAGLPLWISVVLATLGAGAFLGFSLVRQPVRRALVRDLATLRGDMTWGMILYLSAALAFSFSLFTGSLSSDGSVIRMAGGAWSDMTYHLAYIRTVQLGDNVPVQYPYYAGVPIHYHFLSGYFNGKVALAGLDAVAALNLFSVLSLFALLSLLPAVSRRLTGSRSVGMAAGGLLLFHGSLSVFSWLRLIRGTGLVDAILRKDGWLAVEAYESWGLYNLNVLVNQRHFPFALAMVLLGVLVLEEVRSAGSFRAGVRPALCFAALAGALPYWHMIAATCLVLYAGLYFLKAYLPSVVRRMLHWGSPGDRPFQVRVLLMAAGAAGLLVLPQALAMRSGDTVLAGYPRWAPGFAARSGDVGLVLDYLVRTIGLRLPLAAIALPLLPRGRRSDFLLLMTPLLLANLFQFGAVLYDNNKWIWMGLLWAALAVAWLFRFLVREVPAWSRALRISPGDKTMRPLAGPVRDPWGVRVSMGFLAALLAAACVAAGVVDYFAVRNLRTYPIADGASGVRAFIVGHTPGDAVFLSAPEIPYHDDPMISVVLAGRRLWGVRTDVDSSLDVSGRVDKTREFYSWSGEAASLRSALSESGIDYVLWDSRLAGLYPEADPDRLETALRPVFRDGSIRIWAVEAP